MIARKSRKTSKSDSIADTGQRRHDPPMAKARDTSPDLFSDASDREPPVLSAPGSCLVFRNSRHGRHCYCVVFFTLFGVALAWRGPMKKLMVLYMASGAEFEK